MASETEGYVWLARKIVGVFLLRTAYPKGPSIYTYTPKPQSELCLQTHLGTHICYVAVLSAPGTTGIRVLSENLPCQYC